MTVSHTHTHTHTHTDYHFFFFLEFFFPYFLCIFLVVVVVVFWIVVGLTNESLAVGQATVRSDQEKDSQTQRPYFQQVPTTVHGENNGHFFFIAKHKTWPPSSSGGVVETGSVTAGTGAVTGESERFESNCFRDSACQTVNNGGLSQLQTEKGKKKPTVPINRNAQPNGKKALDQLGPGYS